MSALGSLSEWPTLIVAFAVSMVMGVYVVAKIQPNITGLTGEANTTVTAIFSTAYDAFGLLVVGLIVAGAVAILWIIKMIR